MANLQMVDPSMTSAPFAADPRAFGCSRQRPQRKQKLPLPPCWKMWEWLDPIAVLTCVDDLLMLIGYLLDDLLMVSRTPYHAF